MITAVAPVLSVVIPCYNEEKTLEKCVKKVLEIGSEMLKVEVVIVDDCSQDSSVAIARKLTGQFHEIQLVTHDCNQGKGAALKSGFAKATGDYVAVQDADLEYDPQDLLRLIEPLVEDKADVVIGSRFLSYGAHRVLYFWHSMGNWLLTLLSNMMTDLNLTDMETCYKVFKRELVQSISLKEKRFGFEPEVVARIAQKRARIYEMGISYHGRTYAEGKKVGIKDGFRSLYCIVKYNIRNIGLQLQFLFWVSLFSLFAFGNVSLALRVVNADLTTGWQLVSSLTIGILLSFLLYKFTLFRQKRFHFEESERLGSDS